MNIASPWYIDPRSPDHGLLLNGKWDFAWSQERLEPDQVVFDNQVSVPGSVYHQLHECGKMPDPYYGVNSKQFSWVDDCSWYYRRRFTLDRPAFDRAFLCFDGSCYFNRIWLNGTCLGEYKGMFGGTVADVASLLINPGENELIVEVRAANYRNPDYSPRNNNFSVEHPIVPWNLVREVGALDGDFNVIGIWRDVRLEFLRDTHFNRPVITTQAIHRDGDGDSDGDRDGNGDGDSNSDSAELLLEVEISDPKVDELHPLLSSSSTGWTEFTFSFRRGNCGVRQERSLQILIELTEKSTGNTVYSVSENYSPFDWEQSLSDDRYYECHHYRRKITLKHPRLWYPAGMGMGNPELYDVTLTLSENGEQLDRLTLQCGIRTIERIESSVEKHRARWDRFHFVINGKPVFLQGVNWMPIDHFLLLKPEEYLWSLEAARNMGVMMLRVWSGGGIPETEDFYSICDSLGLMVWQDHMIANIDTPNWDYDLLLQQESYNIFRMRKHPSLVIHCGGNEFNPYSNGNLAAVSVIEHAVEDLDSSREWVRTTPDRGSAHIYEDMEPTWYRPMVRQLPFVAESGIHSFPSMKAWKSVVSEKEITQPLANIFSDSFTQKNPEIRNHFVEFLPERIPRMLSRASAMQDIHEVYLADLAEATQLASYEFYQIMAESLRENYPSTTGLMPWVYRRPSVAVGIQLMDGKGNPIAPYYGLKNSYQALTADLMLPHLTFAPGEELPLKVALFNANSQDIPRLTLKLSVLGPDLRVLENRETEVSCSADIPVAFMDLGTFVLPESFTEHYFFFRITLSNAHGILSRKFYWPRCLKRMTDPETYKSRRSGPCPNLMMDQGPWLKDQVLSAGHTTLSGELLSQTITANRQSLSVLIRNTGDIPAFPVVLDSASLPCYASDNYFLLMPGEERIMHLTIFRRDGAVERSILLSAWNADPLSLSLYLSLSISNALSE